jgi:hypothetical protein
VRTPIGAPIPTHGQPARNTNESTTRVAAGTSGNPNGRPKGSVSLTTLIRRALDGNRLGPEPTPDGRTVAEWLVESMIHQAMKGNAACMKGIMLRVEGRIPDRKPEQGINMEMIARRLKKKRSRRPTRT